MATKKVKLSDKQKIVVGIMRTGKQLYFSRGIDASAGFSGGGGVPVSLATFCVLQQLGIIKIVDEPMKSSLSYYGLTKLGKEIEL